MSIRRFAIIIAAAVVFAAGLTDPQPAAAQERRIHAHIGGGPTFPLGEVDERFKMGWGPALGASVDISPRVGLQFEYAYRLFELEDDREAGLISADHSMHQLDFNVMANLTAPDSNVHGYLLGGPGMYHRTVSITRYEGSGVICDPYLYVCGTYPIESVLGDRSSWDFGFNVGAGVGLRFEGVEFYIESRYHYVWGQEVATNGTLPAGQDTSSLKTNSSYWPLTFGFRF
jgi:Outer membrane protein beta-barrel domain